MAMTLEQILAGQPITRTAGQDGTYYPDMVQGEVTTLNNPYGDPRTDPMAMYWSLVNGGLLGGLQRDQFAPRARELLLQAGVDPQYADAVGQAALQSQAANEGDRNESFFGGMLSSGVDFLKDPLIPLALGAAGTYFGAQGLGSLLPSGAAAGGASAGGTAAAAEGAGTALGSGITQGGSATTFAPGMGSATGTGLSQVAPGATAGVGGGAATIGGGALGTGITTPIAATSPWSLASLAPATAGGALTLGSLAGPAGTAATAGSAVSRIMDGTATADDWLSIAGKLAPAALGAYASNEQADAYSDLAERYMGFGAPSRARYEASYAPGFSMENDPGYKDALDQTTKSFLHKASVSGNPAESPNAWQQTLSDVNQQFAYPALQNYRSMNANTGGLASFAPAAVSAAGSSINAERGIYDSIGAGAADVFNPPKSLSDILREFQQARY